MATFSITLHVIKGEPLTRKNLSLLEGRSNVTLRSSKDEITWGAFGLGLFNALMVRSAIKIW